MKVNGCRDGLHSTMGELTLNTNFGSDGIVGPFKGINYKMPRRSIAVPGDKRKLNRRLCSFVILSVLAVWLF